MHRAVAILLVLCLATLALLLGRAWIAPAGPAPPGERGEPTRELDVAVLDVETARLVAGPPDAHPCQREPTAAAASGLALRLASSGFGPAMRRGARPRPTIRVVERVAFEDRRPPAPSDSGGPDCAIYLALERFELQDWHPPRGDAPGRASFAAEGRVWVFLPADGSARTFFGDFAGRHESTFNAAEIEGAPEGEESAAAFLFGRRLLETWQRGLIWRTPAARR